MGDKKFLKSYLQYNEIQYNLYLKMYRLLLKEHKHKVLYKVILLLGEIFLVLIIKKKMLMKQISSKLMEPTYTQYLTVFCQL